MFDKYIIYDAESLLENWNDATETLQGLEEQLKMMGGLSGIDYSKDRIQSTQSGDSLENEAIRKIDLSNKIKTYKSELEMCDKAWNRLTEEEKTILDAMYRQKRTRKNAAEYLYEKLHFEKSTLYRKRDKALERFKWFVFG